MPIKNRIIKYTKLTGSIIEFVIMVPFTLIGMLIALIVTGYQTGYNFIVEQV